MRVPIRLLMQPVSTLFLCVRLQSSVDGMVEKKLKTTPLQKAIGEKNSITPAILANL